MELLLLSRLIPLSLFAGIGTHRANHLSLESPSLNRRNAMKYALAAVLALVVGSQADAQVVRRHARSY
ncbi:MAG: twin-arginine translocation signal domain-containing protein [Gemmataceae bacterium]